MITKKEKVKEIDKKIMDNAKTLMKNRYHFLIYTISGFLINMLLAFPLMWFWNASMPSVFGFKTLVWMQAWSVLMIGCLIIPVKTVKR